MVTVCLLIYTGLSVCWNIELNPVTSHLTGLNTSLKIENLNTATSFTHLHPSDRRRHTYLQGEHLYSALELSLSGFTILNCAGWGTVDYREKYFPSSLSPLLPRHLLQLTNSIGGSELFFSADILPVMEDLVTGSCYWITHINTGTQTRTLSLLISVKSASEIDDW